MEELTAFIIETEPGAERQPDGWECVVFDVADEEEGARGQEIERILETKLSSRAGARDLGGRVRENQHFARPDPSPDGSG